MKTFIVSGIAFVPVECRMEIDARNQSEAMKDAEEKFDRLNSAGRKHSIVPNSDYEGAVHSFRAHSAEEKQ